MRYLIVTDDAIDEKESAESAAKTAGCKPWAWALPAQKLRSLVPGDTLELLENNSFIIVLSGRVEKFQ